MASAQGWYQAADQHAMLLTNGQETDAAYLRGCVMIQCFWYDGAFRLHLGLPLASVPLDGFAAALPQFRKGCVDPVIAELAAPLATPHKAQGAYVWLNFADLRY